MTEATIIRTVVIVVGEVNKNSYGDLTFTDKDGNSYKISAKRTSYFEKTILAGAAVQLNYAMSSFGREYIYNATSVKDKIDAPQAESNLKDKVVSSNSPEIKYQSSPETGIWWNQLGEMLRAGDIDKKTPTGKIMRTAYYMEMTRVLRINIKEAKTAKSSLIEEAKKLGATEVEPENIPF